jgi:hypothetical protein
MLSFFVRLRAPRAGFALSACALALVMVSGCAGEQDREAGAVREFHQRLARNRTDLIYASASESMRAQLSEAQFGRFLSEARSLGELEESERAHFTRAQVPGGPAVIVAFYNSRFSRARCLESFSWRVEGGDLKLAQYSCAVNMQVTCAGGNPEALCETSPVPANAVASLP